MCLEKFARIVPAKLMTIPTILYILSVFYLPAKLREKSIINPVYI